MNAVLASLASRPNWKRFWLLMLMWTVLGLIDAGQFYVHVNYFRGRQIRWEEALASGLADWYVWAALTPFIMALGRRFPIEHANWPRRLLLHLAFGTAFMILKVSLDLPMGWLIHGWDRIVQPLPVDDRFAPDLWHIIRELFKLYVTVKFYVYLMIYAIIIGVAHFGLYYRRYRDRELATSRLEARLAQTQLQVLRTQLHPHFLFNTLNAISALIQEDPAHAERMVERLAALLRFSLDATERGVVPLADELKIVTDYLEIERTRLGERLAFTVEAPAELGRAEVPPLSIQTLVENSVKHAIAPRPSGGRIRVTVGAGDRTLRLGVWDDGPGFSAEPLRAGHGLENLQSRLQARYGDAAALSIEARDGGTLVTVTLPRTRA
jgi:signal transduction histidine kinase